MSSITKNLIVLRLFILLLTINSFGQTAQMIKVVNSSQNTQNVKSSNVDFLTGRITIKIKEVKYHNPPKKGKRRCEQKETSITTHFYGRINKSRVKTYIAQPDERLRCNAYTHCPVFDGGSKYVLERDMNTMKITKSKESPLLVTSKYLEQDFRWIKDQEKFVVTTSTSAAGINTLEGLIIEIKTYMPASNSNGTTLAPLSPAYVLWITGGRDWKLAGEPETNGSNLRWDDAKEKLMPQQGALSLGIPYEINSPEKPREDGENRYEQLLLNDVKGFDNFLLNPIMHYNISASGARYYKDDYSETKTTVNVTISLGPEIELTPLKPEGDPELAPLQPLGDEIQLAPLEPVKD